MNQEVINTPGFKPAWWLNNPHLQTIWPEFMRRPTDIPLKYERFELDGGDFLDLAWSQTGFKDTIIVLHGLGGSVNSPYVRGMIHAVNQYNFNTVALHFRGCSKEPNRHTEMFHAGQTSDLAEVINHLKARSPSERIFVIGFSMGANILLKYLGEHGKSSPVSGAVAISVPFLLEKTQEALGKGFARIYQQYLLTKLKILFVNKLIRRRNMNLDLLSVLIASNFKRFDHLVTAPLHGFKTVNDYYKHASSFSYLKNISAPTLIIHAKDDPFFPASALPKARDLSRTTDLLITEHGGHVGFVTGNSPKAAVYWLEQTVAHYLLRLVSLKSL